MWHTLHIQDVLHKLQSNEESGLSVHALASATKLYGKNMLRSGNTRSVLSIVVSQFTSPLVVILIAASLFSFYLHELRDGTILLLIVVANALFGFYQEWKSENILSSLKKLVVEKCIVIRNSKVIEIHSEDLVPGDIVLLSEGNGVPADIRLIESHDLAVHEFILTGESLPSNKDATHCSTVSVPITEIRNCVFMGTTVARGDAKGIVFATGMETKIGQISSTSEQIQSTDTPIQREVSDVAQKLTFATFIIAFVLFIIRLIMHDSASVALVFAISVAAAMVPEGLPAQISASLALAVGRLAQKNAIVKKLSAAQTLGSATVIATDKTGTITKNEMTITECQFNGLTFTVSGLGYEPHGTILSSEGKTLTRDSLGNLKVFFLSGYLSSTGRINPPDEYHRSWYCIGDPTESAFATLAMKAGYNLEEIDNSYPILQTFRFDSVHRMGAIVREHKGKVISFIKGSLEKVLASSSSITLNDETIPLTNEMRYHITSLAATMAQHSLRVIAIAYKDMEANPVYTTNDAQSNITFAGFVSMFDPPRSQVKEALEKVFAAHIKVFMITGDNEVTAKSIAQKIGLMNPNNELPEVIPGNQLLYLTDEQLQSVFMKRAVIFSRVSPEDKYRIVDLLKQNGEIVAVTGDGVNDTLSLKHADIGIAMGMNGSKVAQEAATMILLDDNFTTIVVAISEGRTIFHNLEKTIKTNLSSNIAELFCVLFGFAGAFFNITIPILAVQILLIDMVGEMFPLIMLTFDPPEKRTMESPPRNPTDKILTKNVMLGIVFSGAVMGLIAYGAFLAEYYLTTASANHYEKALTVTFVTIVFGQYANLLSRRTFETVFTSYILSNVNLLSAFAFSISCILLIVYIPTFNVYFHTAPLGVLDWIFPIASGLLCLCIYEARKYISNRVNNFT